MCVILRLLCLFKIGSPASSAEFILQVDDVYTNNIKMNQRFTCCVVMGREIEGYSMLV
jgi:hypothetical protein